ncbi:WD repeat-containing protein 89 [Harmonia axyridis]|uniref:WD repeat-containing protein 89 n=1 Tax=Harmonia axyridis TaxID=115357 RepID=UPI001E27773C|nr:WD repeat-containing protein 89 [Harmonia axyridis]
MKDLLGNSIEVNSNNDESDQSMEDTGECYNEFVPGVHICEKVLNKEEYITNISATNSSNPKVAVSSSDGNFHVLNLSENFCDVYELNNNSDHIVELKFDKLNDNLLWVASHNGLINLWDLRSNKAVSTFSDTLDDKEDKDKKFNSFDISSSGNVLCAGTNKFEEDSFLLFWDIRKSELAGGFWESHMDDITQVKFHPSDSNKMFSASMDGLINVYDLSRSSEEDALVDTLNTESSIEKISVAQQGTGDVISCITHTSDIQFWKNEDVKPYLFFNRIELASVFKKKSGVYIVDILPTRESILLLLGYNRIIKGFKLGKSSLEPYFGLVKNEQRLKCSWINENTNLLLTGGENGQIDAWKYA